MTKSNSDVEKKWNLFWKRIVCNEDGSINLEQVKKELADYSMIMSHCSKIYLEVSDGMISKPLTLPEVVIAEFNDNYISKSIASEDLIELIQSFDVFPEETKEDMIREIGNYFE